MIDGDDAAKRRGRGAGHRDAYLNGRQKTLGVLLKALDETGQGVLGLEKAHDSTAGPSKPRTPSSKGFKRSEEHTSELQSLAYIGSRLLLVKKKEAATHSAIQV